MLLTAIIERNNTRANQEKRVIKRGFSYLRRKLNDYQQYWRGRRKNKEVKDKIIIWIFQH